MTKANYVYDLEVFPNLFTATFKEFNKDNIRRFVIWHNPTVPADSLNEFSGLIEFLKKEVQRLIGYNNKGYDDLLLNFLIYNREILSRSTPRRISQDIHALSRKIIHSQDAKRARDRAIKDKQKEDKKKDKLVRKDNKYKGAITKEIEELQAPVTEEKIAEYELDKSLKAEIMALTHTTFFSSLDMLNMFATIERISLKQVAINLKWPRVRDLPYPIDYTFTSMEEIEDTLDYNLNDVLITEYLLNKRSEEFRLRVKISQRYGVSVLDSNDTDIGKAIITKYYLEHTKISLQQFRKGRSYYTYVDLKDCISRRIQVRTPESIRLLKHIKKIRVDLVKKETEKQFELIYRSRYLTHTVGMGGLHSVNPPEIIEEDSAYLFLDVDVSGYYSSIIVGDGLYPKHLGPAFTKIYKDTVHVPKLIAKDKGDEIEAAVLKIASLSIYGLTKSETSPFYDPKMTTTVCVSGQLYLIMLIEAIESYTRAMVVYSNTDGLRIRMPREEYYEVMRICKVWEAYTGFILTYKQLRRMVIRDVNNLMLFTYDEKKPIKAIGDFSTELKLSKGYENPIIALAINRFYEKGIPIEDTINNCSDLFMYMKAQRVDTDKFVVRLDRKDGKNEFLQKSNRWIVTDGHPKEGKLYKVRKEGKDAGKAEEMQKGYFVTVINDLPEGENMLPDNQHVNYSFYINETLKITNVLRLSLNKPHEQQTVTQLKMDLS
jgi:hypothetical protein